MTTNRARAGVGAAVLTLRRCQVDVYDGSDVPQRCGQPATWWTAPTGREFFVCPEHRESFHAR